MQSRRRPDLGPCPSHNGGLESCMAGLVALGPLLVQTLWMDLPIPAGSLEHRERQERWCPQVPGNLWTLTLGLRFWPLSVPCLSCSRVTATAACNAGQCQNSSKSGLAWLPWELLCPFALLGAAGWPPSVCPSVPEPCVQGLPVLGGFHLCLTCFCTSLA